MLAGSNFLLFLELTNHYSPFISIVLSAKLAPEVVIHAFKYLKYGTGASGCFDFFLMVNSCQTTLQISIKFLIECSFHFTSSQNWGMST